MYMVLANFKYDIMILGSQHSIRVIDICATHQTQSIRPAHASTAVDVVFGLVRHCKQVNANSTCVVWRMADHGVVRLCWLFRGEGCGLPLLICQLLCYLFFCYRRTFLLTYLLC